VYEPWYYKWTRFLCYSHLILMAVAIKLGLLVELIVGLMTMGLGLPLFFAHLFLVPVSLLPGTLGLVIVDYISTRMVNVHTQRANRE